MLQAPRSSAALEPDDHGERLAEIIRLPEDELDQLILLWLEKHHLIRYAVPRSKRLFFPSTGVFSVPVIDPSMPGQYDFAYAVPIHPRVFIAHVAETARLDGIERRNEHGNFFSIASVGLHSDFVVLPPEVLGANSQDYLCATIREWRQQSRDLVASLTNARDLIANVSRRTGVVFDVDKALAHAASRRRSGE